MWGVQAPLPRGLGLAAAAVAAAAKGPRNVSRPALSQDLRGQLLEVLVEAEGFNVQLQRRHRVDNVKGRQHVGVDDAELSHLQAGMEGGGRVSIGGQHVGVDGAELSHLRVSEESWVGGSMGEDGYPWEEGMNGKGETKQHAT